MTAAVTGNGGPQVMSVFHAGSSTKAVDKMRRTVLCYEDNEVSVLNKSMVPMNLQLSLGVLCSVALVHIKYMRGGLLRPVALVSVCHVGGCAKTAERIEILLGMETLRDSRNIVLKVVVLLAKPGITRAAPCPPFALPEPSLPMSMCMRAGLTNA